MVMSVTARSCNDIFPVQAYLEAMLAKTQKDEVRSMERWWSIMIRNAIRKK